MTFQSCVIACTELTALLSLKEIEQSRYLGLGLIKKHFRTILELIVSMSLGETSMYSNIKK